MNKNINFTLLIRQDTNVYKKAYNVLTTIHSNLMKTYFRDDLSGVGVIDFFRARIALLNFNNQAFWEEYNEYAQMERPSIYDVILFVAHKNREVALLSKYDNLCQNKLLPEMEKYYWYLKDLDDYIDHLDNTYYETQSLLTPKLKKKLHKIYLETCLKLNKKFLGDDSTLKQFTYDY